MLLWPVINNRSRRTSWCFLNGWIASGSDQNRRRRTAGITLSLNMCFNIFKWRRTAEILALPKKKKKKERKKEDSKILIHTCVAEPKAWPKSIPIIFPSQRSIMKFDKCRSPIPSRYWQMLTRACDTAKFCLSVKKASGEQLMALYDRLQQTSVFYWCRF